MGKVTEVLTTLSKFILLLTHTIFILFIYSLPLFRVVVMCRFCCRELQRMVDDTNAWLDTDEMVAKVRRIATRLAHSHAAANNAIRSLSPRH